MKQKLQLSERRQALSATAVAFIAVYFLWNMPILNIIVYPLRLFVTYVHEAGHSLAALATGGRVLEFVVASNGSGFAVTSGGSRALILPAGYLGAALFGSVLFYWTNRHSSTANKLAIALGIGMILFTIAFAKFFSLATPIGIGFGILLIAIGWQANRFLTLFVLNVLSIMTALNAVLDIWILVRYSDLGNGEIRNDAAVFADSINLPTEIVAVVWAGIAVLMLGFAVWHSVAHQFRREVDDAFAVHERTNS